MPRSRLGLILALVTSAGWFGETGSAAAATSSSVNEKTAICTLTPCRSAQHVGVRADDNVHQYEAVFDPSPYVWNGVITIYPGEALVFRFTGTAENPGTPVFVRTIVPTVPRNVPPSDFSAQSDATTDVQHDPKSGENLYVFRNGSPYAPSETAQERLKNEPPGTAIVSFSQAADSSDMVLRVDHNLPGALKYDALIDRLGPNGDQGFERTTICPVRPNLAGMETWPYPLGAAMLQNFRFVSVDNGFNCD